MAVTVAVMLFGAACSGSTDDPAPTGAGDDPGPVEVSAPAGFRVHRGEEYGFVWPSDWTPVPGGGTFVAGAEMEIVGPTGDAGLPALITVYREEGFEGDFQRYLFAFNGEASTALADRAVIRNERATVPQSVEAQVIESEYTLPGLVAPAPEPTPTPEGDDKKKSKKRRNKQREKADDKTRAQPGENDEEPDSEDAGEQDDSDGSVTIRQVDILVMTRENVTINLRAAAPAEDFDDFSEIFTAVLNSLRVQPPSVGAS